MSKVPISVLIPIKNEQYNLARCLTSISWADEIFVVDSQSLDRSVEIAESYGAQVVQFQFDGIWPKKKNWALENLPFRNEWVFILDADEVLPVAAEQEFRKAIAAPKPTNGYWINRRFLFMGKWLRHAYYPNWNLRLFRHSLGRYEKLTDGATQSGDNEVHEHILLPGETRLLRCEMDHYAFPSLEIFVEKHNRYSNWEARVVFNQSKEIAPFQNFSVRLRRRLKQISQKLPFRPFLRFLYVYFWQKGFLDGWEGYYFARLHAIYELFCVAKTFELKKNIHFQRGEK